MKTTLWIISITVPIAVIGIIFSPLILEAYYLEKKYQEIGYPQDFDIENCKDDDQCIEWFENGTCKTMVAKRCVIPEPEQKSSTFSLCDSFEELKRKRDVTTCPLISTSRSFEILETKGLEICQKPSNTYYVIQAGNQASITYQTFRGFDYNDPPLEDAQKPLIKKPQFHHETDSGKRLFTPEGIQVTFNSTSPTLGFNDTATLTASISVDIKAPSKTLWLGLSPFECHGGTSVRFAIIGDD